MKANVLILAIHQSHVGSKAGGYIRLKEFLKYIPQTINYKIIDLSPSIYEGIAHDKDIITVSLPKIILFLLKNMFVAGVFLERIYTAIAAYYVGKKIIKDENIKVIYVPIGEFLHLYLPAVLLKKTFRDVKIVTDILNFQIYEEGFFSVFKAYTNNSSNYLISAATAIISYLSFILVKKTIDDVDYIFTVSPQLVNTISKIYKAKTIDYTPSGVDSSLFKNKKVTKKYLGVYIGRVTEQKGILNVLDVWKEIVQSKSDAKLAIAGLIDKEQLQVLRDRIINLGLQKNIIVFGEVTEKEKIRIITESEIFLHLANYEPLFPVIGILEGCAGGLPIIIFDMPVSRAQLHEIKYNDFIYAVSNGNIRKASEAVITLNNFADAKKIIIAKHSRNYALQFDWQKIAQKEFSVIEKYIYEK